MEDTELMVKMTPGTIETNFESVKMALEDHLKDYRTIVYTDETIGDASKDLAKLRKARADVEDKRKEIKNRCLEPYSIIESQMKELTGLIDSTISSIKQQSDAYEDRRQEAKKKEIIEFWKKNADGIPGEIRHHCLESIWNPKWYKNKTYADSAWKSEINAEIESVTGDLTEIRNMRSEFEPELIAKYYETLNLRDVVAKKSELDTQKQRILERERQKREQEEQRRREEELHKEQERKEREEEKNRPESVSPSEKVREDTATIRTNTVEKVEAISPDKAEAKPEAKAERIYECKLLIRGTMEQMKKLSGYAQYINMEVHMVKGSQKLCN